MNIEEVRTHCTDGDSWCVIHGQVYDISKYAGTHPGGSFFLHQASGCDATNLFMSHHLSSKPFETLRSMHIGRIEGATESPPPGDFFLKCRDVTISKFREMKKSPYHRPFNMKIRVPVLFLMYTIWFFLCRVKNNWYLLPFQIMFEAGFHELVHTNSHGLLFSSEKGSLRCRHMCQLVCSGHVLHHYHGRGISCCESMHLTHHLHTGNDHLDPEWHMRRQFYGLALNFMRWSHEDEWHAWHKYQHMLRCLIAGILGPFMNLAELYYQIRTLYAWDRVVAVRNEVPTGEFNHKILYERFGYLDSFSKKMQHICCCTVSSLFGPMAYGCMSLPVIDICCNGFANGCALWLVACVMTNVVFAVLFDMQHFGVSTMPNCKTRQLRADSHWGDMQLRATASIPIGIFNGGFQIEHHLFPSVSPAYYPHLQQIIRAECIASGLPYNQASIQDVICLWKQLSIKPIEKQL